MSILDCIGFTLTLDTRDCEGWHIFYLFWKKENNKVPIEYQKVPILSYSGPPSLLGLAIHLDPEHGSHQHEWWLPIKENSPTLKLAVCSMSNNSVSFWVPITYLQIFLRTCPSTWLYQILPYKSLKQDCHSALPWLFVWWKAVIT